MSCTMRRILANGKTVERCSHFEKRIINPLLLLDRYTLVEQSPQSFRHLSSTTTTTTTTTN
ncbi:Uncharacterized protein APZ42_005289 [Daphnia magna]|uniref:Uncharacterized protein n=1 Tax=Daphnia magna TaxID=35525 RepID=A0A162D5A9_9CRUS|nr:Uncharacterized protein APZ42_005289 [Daphnia magna]